MKKGNFSGTFPKRDGSFCHLTARKISGLHYLESGYLTKAVKERMSLLPLRISDQGVRLAFRQEVWSDFRGKVGNVFMDG